MAQQAQLDQNYTRSLLGVSELDDKTTVAIRANPTTKRLEVDALVAGMLIQYNWDSVTRVLSPDTVETWTFRLGGTIVSTVVITYTDNTLGFISTVTRT